MKKTDGMRYEKLPSEAGKRVRRQSTVYYLARSVEITILIHLQNATDRVAMVRGEGANAF